MFFIGTFANVTVILVPNKDNVEASNNLWTHLNKVETWTKKLTNQNLYKSTSSEEKNNAPPYT